MRSSPVTSRIQPPKLICIVPSNSAGSSVVGVACVWCGVCCCCCCEETGQQRVREAERRRKPERQSGPRCNPGGFSTRRRPVRSQERCATSCSSTAPAPAVEVVPSQLRSGTRASPAQHAHLGRATRWAAQTFERDQNNPPQLHPTQRACDQSSGRPGVTATFRDPVRED